MKEFDGHIKPFLTTLGALISAKLGILAPIIYTLVLAMLIDYITGMIASAMDEGLSSKKGIKGILKKTGYICVVAVAMITDWLIVYITQNLGIDLPMKTFVGALVCVWLILNELVSIIENLGRAGTPLPKFLIDIVSILKKKIEDKGENDNA